MIFRDVFSCRDVVEGINVVTVKNLFHSFTIRKLYLLIRTQAIERGHIRAAKARYSSIVETNVIIAVVHIRLFTCPYYHIHHFTEIRTV